MELRIGSVVFVGWMLLGCGDGGASRPDPDESSTTSDEVATTIPPTTLTTTIDGDGSSAEASDDAVTSTTSEATDSGAASTTTAADGTSSDGTSRGSTGEPTLDLQWCNLQYPPTIPQPDDSPTYDSMVTPGEPTTIYTRVYVEGLTDATEFVDASDQLIAEVGYGPEGSDPAAAQAWTWTAASGNPGWNGTRADGFGQENNDEYIAELSFAEPGTFDYAARYSIDGGATYVYCDLDGLAEDDYTPEQAGAAVVVADR